MKLETCAADRNRALQCFTSSRPGKRASVAKSGTVTMNTLRFSLGAALCGCLLRFATANAQLVNDVNALQVKPNVVRADPGTLLSIDASGYPALATISESGFTNNGNPTQFNRHDLIFSANGGASGRKFQNQEPFDISVDVTLSAMFDSPRKEAGLRINFFGFDGQFIVNTDAGEIVAFGGTLPFYSFTASPGTDPPGGGLAGYVNGETINMRMIYTPPVLDSAMPPAIVQKGTIQYVVDRGTGPVSSPVLEFSGTESGIIDNSEIGVYSQATGQFGTVNDFVNVVFENFDFDGPPSVDNADFNGDLVVNGSDFLIWQRGVGTASPTLANGNANGDNAVDGLDLAVWQSQFGNGASASTAVVPEPLSGCLLLVGASVFAIGRRWRRASGVVLC